MKQHCGQTVKLRRYISIMLPMAVLASAVRAQTSDAFTENLLRLPVESRQHVVDSFFTHSVRSPFYGNDTVVTFIYNGHATAVSVAGDMNGWTPNRDTLVNIAGTTLWSLRMSFEADARLDYKFVVDRSSWILDPLNDRRVRGGFGENSELRMPGYPPQPELRSRDDVPRGFLRDTVVHSSGLGNDRRVSVYLPASTGTDSLGMIVVHDGLEFISLAGMTTVLDNLIADGDIPPVVAVFVPPVDRTAEYDGERRVPFASFVVHTVIPIARTFAPISTDPSRSAVFGASSGGNCALSMGMLYPDVFGNVAAFSSNVIPAVAERFAAPDHMPLRIYLDIGTYDIPVLLPRVRGLRDALAANGYSYLYAEHHDGHSWANWSAHIDDALRFLLSSSRR